MLAKTKFPFIKGEKNALVGETGERRAVGFEIEFYYDGISNAFKTWAKKNLGEDIDSVAALVNYLSSLQAHPLFMKVYKDGDNIEICTEPMTLEVMYEVKPIMDHLFLQFKVFQFLCMPYSNVDINLDYDFFSSQDWLNLFRFFIKNPEFLVYHSGRKQSAQDKADFRYFYKTYYSSSVPFVGKRTMAKHMHNFARTVEEKGNLESFAQCHMRFNRIEIKWFGNPFDYATMISYVELLMSIVNFKKESKSYKVEDYFDFLQENCLNYKFFFNKVKQNPFGYLHVPGLKS